MRTEVIQINPQEPEVEKVKHAASVLRQGGLVVIPTETVYGIAADMLNEKTMQRLYAVKKRHKDKPFSLHLPFREDVEKYTTDILPAAYRLMESFWPGPLTLVLKSKNNGKIGIRMPNHKVALSIIIETAAPVVCPSANFSGNLAPCTAQEALEELSGLVDLVVDAGKTPLGIESTVVDVTKIPIEILRKGAISQEEIERVTNKKTILFVCTGNSCRSVMAKTVLEKVLKEKNRNDVEVLSAGIMMLGGLSPTEETKEVLKKEGIDVSEYRSQRVTKEIIKKSDIILVMERLHEKRILELAPLVKNRLFLLKEFAKIDDTDLDIADPIARPVEFYEDTLRIIKEAVERISNIV